MPPKSYFGRGNFNRGRNRNRIKFSKWSFYLKGDDIKQGMTMTCLKAAAKNHKGRVQGGSKNLVLRKVYRSKVEYKVELSWPQPVSADSCAQILKHARGKNWRDFVSDPAGVQGAAATAKNGVVAAEAAGEEGWEDALDAAVKAIASGVASSSTADSLSAPSPSAGSSCPGTMASSAATVEACSNANLLSLKLETIVMWYRSKNRSDYEDPQQVYTVNWAEKLGQGNYGKVYVGRKRLATGLRSFAIKMLRDKETDKDAKSANAVLAANREVTRHVMVGFHPNVVGLVDVGVFFQPSHPPRCNSLFEPSHPPRCNSRSAHIGLVFDMYEIDVKQFLTKSSFTQGGMRHVLNSVLEGLRFIHDRGCIHGDLTPANIFMRGAMHLRGCFSRGMSELQELGHENAVAPDPHSMTEFQYQIPKSFEVRSDPFYLKNLHRKIEHLKSNFNSNQKSKIENRNSNISSQFEF